MRGRYEDFESLALRAGLDREASGSPCGTKGVWTRTAVRTTWSAPGCSPVSPATSVPSARDIEEAVGRDDETAGVFRRRRTLGTGLDRDALGTTGGLAGQTPGQSEARHRRPTVGEFVAVFNPGPAERRSAKRRTPPPVEAGVVDDVQDEEEREWLEPHDKPAQWFHRLVRHLTADGDQRAAAADRKARRTLAEMAPGHVRQPLLTPTSAGRGGAR
ncbi:hypothetical protein CRV15_28775 (plasmid) [Streptomyces clavuligerus]|uniref:Uncharacterized protein n=1 Tax=Streptomyces clavuligerus TaxID=1901 RepID=B5GVX2_STRCL|nr:hypothetical protein SSCG_03615 [Streptomyces clavuligerus]EFG03627.1 Hypothetical protein SCLAV_p0136 [Streptomyces clavuligerus]QCS09640.1 hypothetical protein CRV15_28775 [Streptomyces clavuligerus]QPJ98315.1 hypothetical protein GE265_35565 [Streptomyces clavuligerus]